jgi:hypothetical protein
MFARRVVVWSGGPEGRDLRSKVVSHPGGRGGRRKHPGAAGVWYQDGGRHWVRFHLCFSAVGTHVHGSVAELA